MKIKTQQSVEMTLDNHTRIELAGDDDEITIRFVEPSTGYGMQEKIGQVMELNITAKELTQVAEALQDFASNLVSKVATFSITPVVKGSPEGLTSMQEAIADEARKASMARTIREVERVEEEMRQAARKGHVSEATLEEFRELEEERGRERLGQQLRERSIKHR